MKNSKLIGLSMMILGAVACTKNGVEPTKDPVLRPIRQVVAMDGQKEVAAEIDHAARTIKFAAFENVEDLSAVDVKFKVAEGATLVSPKEVAKLDLTKAVEVVVNNAVINLTYTMTAEKPVLNPVKKAGFEPAENYGNFPEHLKLYVNNKLGADKKVIGYLAEISKGATISVLGNGDNNAEPKKTIMDWANEQKDWTFYFNCLSGMKSATVVDEKLIYSSGSPFPVFAVDNDGSFTVCPQRHKKVDGKYVDVLEKLDLTGKVINDNWLPKVACGGYYMVAANGKALSDEEMKKTGAFNTWFNGDATAGREFIGVNKAGDKAYCLVVGNAEGGLSMREAVAVMLSVGCENVMTLEGSSSANMLVRGQETVKMEKFKTMSSILVVK